mgnify:CR=1 FL=1
MTYNTFGKPNMDLGGVGLGTESFSYRASELPKRQRSEIKAQNKAAQSMKSVDLDAQERGKKAAETNKLRQQEREDYAHSVGEKKGEKKGMVKGAVATAVVGAVGHALLDKDKKKQGTQADHHVTDSKNHTKPASKMESAKRPAVGADVDAKKKYGSKSWNNGYTN